MPIDRSKQNWPAWTVFYVPAEKLEDRLTAETGARMVEMVIDILRKGEIGDHAGDN